MSIEPLKSHLNDELFNKLSGQIKHHYIESENPEHHWNYLHVNEQIVLDLGCGFHLMEPGWLNTPEYFLNKGAKKVIGIDTERGDINKFKTMYPNCDFYCDAITRTDQLNNYILNNSVTSLKMDIEGSETCFIYSDDYFSSLKHIAIETHNRNLLNDLIHKLLKINFKIDTICTFYPRVYEVCNLVYANR